MRDHSCVWHPSPPGFDISRADDDILYWGCDLDVEQVDQSMAFHERSVEPEDAWNLRQRCNADRDQSGCDGEPIPEFDRPFNLVFNRDLRRREHVLRDI